MAARSQNNGREGPNTRPLNAPSSVGSSVGYSDGGGESKPRLRYTVPLWGGCTLIFVTMIFALVAMGFTVYHYRHDYYAYVCNDDDTHAWACDSSFDFNPPECDDIPYSPLATGGEFELCFYGECVYFKVWGPMPPYPCITSGPSFPTVGVRHCIDMIDDSYDKKDRLIAHIYCDEEGDPICIFEHRCSQYALISGFETESVATSAESVRQTNGRNSATKSQGMHFANSKPASVLESRLSSLTEGSDRMNETLNGENVFEWAAKMAKKNTKPQPPPA